MARPKGQPKLGGRKKGTPNKLTAQVKDMVLQALENVGGAAYLEQQAIQNPGAFMTLVGKVIPVQLTGGGGEPLLSGIQITFVGSDSQVPS